MRSLFVVLKRELLSYRVSLSAYLVLTFFTLLSAFFFFNLLGSFNHALQEFAALPFQANRAAPNLNQWVVEGYFQTLIVLLVFVVPLLTMRLFSAEYAHGVFELLMTSPLSPASLILGKFLSLLILVTLMLCLSFVFPLLLFFFGNPELLPVLVGAGGVFLVGIAFCAIGVAFSSLISHQLTAGFSTLMCLLLLYMLHVPASDLEGPFAEILRSLSPMWQARELVRGVLSLQSISYFLSISVFAVCCAMKACQQRRVLRSVS